MITADQVTVLAPDAASFKAGKGLAVASKWSELSRTETMLWGLAKGSGSKPYQTQVSIGDFATNCSCPSRKFPCKHALGLLFLAADDLSLFKETAAPDWVSDWQGKREASAQKKAAKSKAPTKKKATSQKSKDKRSARVDEGIALLEENIFDLVRGGLGNAVFDWHELSRRLVDCQAPGLARFTARLAEIRSGSPLWEQRLVHELGSLYLLLHAYKGRTELDTDLRAEVEQRIGWTVDKDDVLNGTRLQDNWTVLYRTVSSVDRLTVYSNRVYGSNNRQWGLMLSFVATGSVPAGFWPVGASVDTELAFYPGACLERALPTDDNAALTLNAGIDLEAENISDFLTRVSNNVAANPWSGRFPFLLNAQPVTIDNTDYLVDAEGNGLPLTTAGDEKLTLTAMCGGRPTLLAGEWDGSHCSVYSASDAGAWIPLREAYV